jgi:hypothetical protein
MAMYFAFLNITTRLVVVDGVEGAEVRWTGRYRAPVPRVRPWSTGLDASTEEVGRPIDAGSDRAYEEER